MIVDRRLFGFRPSTIYQISKNPCYGTTVTDRPAVNIASVGIDVLLRLSWRFFISDRSKFLHRRVDRFSESNSVYEQIHTHTNTSCIVTELLLYYIRTRNIIYEHRTYTVYDDDK